MKTVMFDLDTAMFDTQFAFSLAWDHAGERMGMGKAGIVRIEQGRRIFMARNLDGDYAIQPRIQNNVSKQK